MRSPGADSTRPPERIDLRRGSLVDRETFDRRLARLEEVLRSLESLRGLNPDDLLRNKSLQAQLERWLHLATECCLDLAHHLISDRGWKTPTTYREAYAVLEAEGVLPEVLADQMKQWAGLRNVLVHMYMDVDYSILHRIVENDLDQLREYAAHVSRAAAES